MAPHSQIIYKKRSSASWAVAWLLATCVVSVQAQDALLQNAKGMLASRQAGEAYQLLSPQESARAGQPEFDYLLGIAALDSGRATQAIFAFERVLAVQPANSLARAELARAYLKAGEKDAAHSQLNQVKAAPDVPPEARASVERLLSSLSDDGRSKPLTMYFEAGLGRDSNLSGGPNITQFAVPGFGLTTLPAASQQRDDGVLQLGAGLAWRQVLSSATEFNAQINLRATQPFKEHTLDNQSIDGSLGLAHTVGALRLSASLQLASLQFNGDTYRKTAGFTLQALHTLSDSSRLMGFMQLAQQDFPTQILRDARRSVVGGAWDTALSPSSSVYLGFALGGEKAKQAAGAEFGYRLWGLRAGAEHVFTQQIRGFANLGLERHKHRALDTVFADTRLDKQLDLSLGLHYQLSPASYGIWRVTPQVSWTNRSSNLSVYEMRRTQLGITARLDF